MEEYCFENIYLQKLSAITLKWNQKYEIQRLNSEIRAIGWLVDIKDTFTMLCYLEKQCFQSFFIPNSLNQASCRSSTRNKPV